MFDKLFLSILKITNEKYLIGNSVAIWQFSDNVSKLKGRPSDLYF
jgi:hypothetical protein